MLWIIRQKTEEMKEKRRSSLVPKGEAVAKWIICSNDHFLSYKVS